MPTVSYLDTCCLMMFIDRRDPLRREYGLKDSDIVKKVSTSHDDFRIPMPAFGEALCKIAERGGSRNDALAELIRLMDLDFIKVGYLHDREAFILASRISYEHDDGRDRISLMDAFILASAAVDPECTRVYTSDNTLLTSTPAIEIVSEYRDVHSMPELLIKDMDFIRP